jgi:hypothetical protein
VLPSVRVRRIETRSRRVIGYNLFYSMVVVVWLICLPPYDNRNARLCRGRTAPCERVAILFF